MSEYQYYEFQAVDRPLTPAEITDLRALSTRARITPTQLQNVYHWGDFRGDPMVLMERYFDIFIYVANWGTHRFMLRLPRRLLDPQTVRVYAVAATLDVHVRGDFVILEFRSEDEEGMGWIDDDEAESWMPALLPLRAELANGDPRGLYLGWLAGVAAGELDDEVREPPVPPGLGQTSAALETLTRFLRISDDLLTVAATASPDLPEAPSPSDLQRWIADLQDAEKDALLLQLTDNPLLARAEVLRRFRQECAPQSDASTSTRTAATLRATATERRDERIRREAVRQAAEQARRNQEAAVARSQYLDGLVGREEELWQQIDALVEMKRAKEYDQAVQLLQDLHDVNALNERFETFTARLGAFQERYATRRGLLDRLDQAGLRV
jgi:hypothetical protein